MKKVVLAFLILTVPRQCPAKYSGGSGTASAPYKIGTVTNLLTFAEDINDYNKCFILTADIDLDPDLPGGQIFSTAVIARDTNNVNGDFDGNAFAGIFDGAGHKISNLTINTSGSGNDYLGLFGKTCGGQIKNLRLINISITGGDGSQWLGALAAGNCSSISDCSSSGTIRGGSDLTYAGGLVGENSGEISNCSSTATVTSKTGAFFIGGLTGYNYTNNISDSFSTGDVNCGDGSAYIGGLAGYNFGGDINNCASAGNVTGGNSSNSVGGLAGENDGDINNCHSSGAVRGGDDSSGFGGLVGENFDGKISNCYSTGLVGGGTLYDAGGLTGYSEGKINSSYFLATNGPDNGFGTPLTDAQMKQKNSFAGWDFNDVWRICEGTNYPTLLRQVPPGDYLCPDGADFFDFAFLAGHWLQTDYGKVTTLAEFVILAEYWEQTDCGACGGADYSGDGKVDSADLAILCDNWLAVDYGDVGGAEITGDGVVDIDDLLVFSNGWLKEF